MFIIIYLTFLLTNSTYFKLNENNELKELYKKHISIIRESNQFECSGLYKYNNQKTKTFDTFNFSGTIFRNRTDTIIGRSFLIDYYDRIQYYCNYKNYVLNKNNNRILFNNVLKYNRSFYENTNILYNIFNNFIELDYHILEFMGSDKFETFVKIYENTLEFKTNKKTRTYSLIQNIEKLNFYPTFYSMIVKDDPDSPKYEEWHIENLVLSKIIDTSKINFDSYLNKYPIYEHLIYKNKTCFVDSSLIGNKVFDNYLNYDSYKLVAIYQEGANLNEDYLLEDINKIDIDDLNVNIYKFNNDTLFLKNNGINKIVDFNLLHQYSVNYSPCFYLLDSENNIVDYFYGYNNTQRIDFNEYFKGKLND
jgi:hypothetical protein